MLTFGNRKTRFVYAPSGSIASVSRHQGPAILSRVDLGQTHASKRELRTPKSLRFQTRILISADSMNFQLRTDEIEEKQLSYYI